MGVGDKHNLVAHLIVQLDEQGHGISGNDSGHEVVCPVKLLAVILYELGEHHFQQIENLKPVSVYEDADAVHELAGLVPPVFGVRLADEERLVVGAWEVG